MIKPKHYGQVSADAFSQLLSSSIAAWKSSGKRGVWLTIPIAQSELIPVAAKVCIDVMHMSVSHLGFVVCFCLL